MPDFNFNDELIPTGQVEDVIGSIGQASVVLRLAHVVSMPQGVMSIPVVSVAPQADFVERGGRKPLATIDWSAERLVPEEIAAVTFIPDAYVNDVGFPIWESCRDELGKAIAAVLDAALLFGTGAPASYPANGVAGTGAPQITGTDALDALSQGMSAIEGDGLLPNGIASSPAIGGAMRTAWQNVAALPSDTPGQTLWGVPVAVSAAWDATKGDAIVGDWSKLVVGIREDVTFDTSQDGILLDDAGAIQVSAFQDDVTLIRVHCRIAAAIGTPVGPDGTATDPFQSVKWTGGTTARSSAKASS